MGLEAGEDSGADEVASKFTHILLLEPDVYLEDGWSASAFSMPACSKVCIPDQDGTMFAVVFVEREHPGTPADHKKVYLCRVSVTWPTDEL